MQKTGTQDLTLIETDLPIYTEPGEQATEQVLDAAIDSLPRLLFDIIDRWLNSGICVKDETGLIDFDEQHQGFCDIIK